MGFSLFRKVQKRPDNMLPDGWQFYSRPTNLAPPGTIFRIDPEGRRFIVDRLKPVVDSGAEPGIAWARAACCTASASARKIGRCRTYPFSRRAEAAASIPASPGGRFRIP